MSSEFDELIIEFLQEVKSGLEECEQDFLELETPQGGVDQLTKIFRVAHSIKGGGAMVGLLDLSSFAHKVEDLLAILRINPELKDSEVITLLLASGDELKFRIDSLLNADNVPWNPEALIEKVIAKTAELERLIGGVPSVEIKPIEKSKVDDDFRFPDSVSTIQSSTNETNHNSEEKVSHEVEQINQEIKTKANSPARVPIKVDAARVDGLLDLVGELVIIKSQIMESELNNRLDLQTQSMIGQLDKLIRELYDRSLGIRMTSVKPLFTRIQRAVRDLSVKQEKGIELIFEGETTELDRSMIDVLADPVVHIARNAVDHGIESTEDRVKFNKPKNALMKVVAQHEGNRVVLRFEDDGRGIDAQKVLNKAIERNVPGANQPGLSNEQIFDFLFAPGFSTAEKVTDVSGRGVGLDVVKSKVESIGGTVKVISEVGRGTTFRLEIPLTAAIIDGIILSDEKIQYIIPIDSVSELIRFDKNLIVQGPDGFEALKVRDSVLPLVYLGQALGKNTQNNYHEKKNNSRSIAIVIERQGCQFAVLVDQVNGQGQFVVKPISSNEEVTSEIVSGGSILGDGGVALILDVDKIIRVSSKSRINGDEYVRSA